MGSSKVRRPVVAGQFYPGTPEELTKEIESLVDKKASKQDVIACMLPHAGYVYSGRVAAETVSHINIREKRRFLLKILSWHIMRRWLQKNT